MGINGGPDPAPTARGGTGALLKAQAGPESERRPVSRREASCLALMLLIYLGAMAWLAWRTGITVDEPAHLMSAYLYWQGADNLEPNDMPPAIKIASGWVVHLTGFPIPYDHASWETRQEWDIAVELMQRMTGAEAQRRFFLARLPMLVFPTLCVILLWWWGRQWLGPPAALMAAAAFMMEPTAMGHGALVKNDLATTLAYLFFWYRAWRFWRAPGMPNAAWLGAGVLAGMLAKMSLLILVGIAPIVVLARFLSIRPVRWRAAAGAVVLVLLIPYLGAIVAWQFETSRLSEEQLESYRQDPTLPAAVAAGARIFRLIPVVEPLWQGALSLVGSNAAAESIYLLGRLNSGGHPLYFLLTLAVKVPVALQLLFLAGLALAVSRLGRESRLWFWLIPPVIYVGLASLSNLQLGLRLILPGLPFGLLLAGAALQRLWTGRGRAVALAMLAGAGAESASVYPHSISFYNLWIGGPDNGNRYLSGSNIDWGQDLPHLPALVHRLGIEKIRISYFGMSNLWSWFREGEYEILLPPWDVRYAKGEIYQPEPGYYAISATLLTGQFLPPEYREYYKVFRESKPFAKCGYSIFLYKFP